jgi:quinol monooxygenase YgiN
MLMNRREFVGVGLAAMPLAVAQVSEQPRQGGRMSVLVLIDLKVKTALVESTTARLQEGLQDIRKFDGCEEALMHVNQDDSANLLFAERWTSRGKYEAYRAWRAQRGDNAWLTSTLIGPLVVRVFDVLA